MACLMTQNTTPRIEDRWVCIATNKQAVLAAVVSSYFQEEGVYFPVFEFPSVEFPYSFSIDFGRDGYFARILGHHAAVRINNALARIHPKSILLLGLTETEKSHLSALLPSAKLMEINTIEDIGKKLPFALQKCDPVVCKSSQVIEGLLLAKFTRRHLVVDEDAPTLPAEHLHGGVGILVIENDRNVHDVAAINYAFSINTDVVLVAPVGKELVRSLPGQLRAWSNDNSHYAFQELRRETIKRIKGIDFVRYKFTTFFTAGLPYGLIIKNIIPCSHVLKELACGVFIATNLSEEHDPMSFDSSVLFSPQLFPSEETEEIRTILDNSNYTVKLLLGRDATVEQLTNYGSYFPFDVMHICAHGGETDGYFVVQEFTDRQGAQHKFEYYEVVGFAPAANKMVSVTRKAIFKTFDGFPWMSRPLKSLPHYVFEDMLKALRSDDNLVRVRVDYPIALSCHIQCHDSIHQGSFHSLAGFGHPVVFNNSCSSSHELAATFIDAGARSYIGTLWGVENETAMRAGTVFYEEAVKQGGVLAAFVAMNKSVSAKKYQNVYILWGLHFSSFRKPLKKDDSKILRALVSSFLMWKKKIETTADREVKRNSIPIAKFILEEIVKNFSQQRLDEIRNFDPTAVQDHERTSPGPAQDDFSRGVTEVEVP